MEVALLQGLLLALPQPSVVLIAVRPSWYNKNEEFGSLASLLQQTLRCQLRELAACKALASTPAGAAVPVWRTAPRKIARKHRTNHISARHRSDNARHPRAGPLPGSSKLGGAALGKEERAAREPRLESSTPTI